MQYQQTSRALTPLANTWSPGPGFEAPGSIENYQDIKALLHSS